MTVMPSERSLQPFPRAVGSEADGPTAIASACTLPIRFAACAVCGLPRRRRNRAYAIRVTAACGRHRGLDDPDRHPLEELERWLCDAARFDGECLAKGNRYELALAGGGRVTGRVLARTPRELLFDWPERRGVLGLKAFSMGGQQMLALDFNGGGRAADAAAAWRRFAEGTLNRDQARQERKRPLENARFCKSIVRACRLPRRGCRPCCARRVQPGTTSRGGS